MRFYLTQKASQFLLVSSFPFSLQQIWTEWPKLHVKFSTFVKLEKCRIIQTHWRKATWEMFISIWNFVCENNNDRSRWHSNKLDLFHDVNSILYTGYPLVGILRKVLKIFLGENLDFSTVTNIRCIWNSRKNKNSKTG